ncbi:hypothetical protein [Desulfogranum marinum]|uniref:hypothetical protein n=1 Tax=Desulfogranum marinum TaxID=453220 RepID=UPI0019634FC9|nr:hypothetical protein [Desulfogranum marinum]MBM9514702.1 hypothetical protein [Desulfogranum marinum]
MSEPFYHYRPLDRDLDLFISDSIGVIEELKSDGYRISDSSRFPLFLKELSNFIKCRSQVEFNSFDKPLLADGFRDFAELNAIVKSQKIRKENRKEIQKIFGGTRKPSEDNLTQARDFQFELYLAAIFDLSGFFVEIAEPDFKFEYKGTIYSVAAKRISSESKIQTRFSKAKKQIKKCGIPGFIAFSIDRIVWDNMNDDCYIVTNDPDSLYKAGQSTLHQLLKSKIKEAAWKHRDPLVVGHIASFAVPALVKKQGEMFSLGICSNQLFIPSFDLRVGGEMYTNITEIPGQIKWPPQG